jgi:hypothetical protein
MDGGRLSIPKEIVLECGREEAIESRRAFCCLSW